MTRTIVVVLALACVSLLGDAFATRCADIIRKPQTQPATYLSASQGASRAAFESLEKSVLHVNKEIPVVCDEAVRIATYNVHFHRTMRGTAKDPPGTSDNTHLVREDLRRFNPTIVIFEEVIADASSPFRVGFESMLQSLGYTSRVFARGGGSFLGNMIASKVPLDLIARESLGPKRSLLAVSANTGQGKIAILGTHLDEGSDAARRDQTAQIVGFIRRHIVGKYDRYLLAGDMNAHWRSAEIQNLAKSGLLREAFNSVGAPYPQYTSWAGTTIDFIFASPTLAGEAYGAYVYHTVSSDHLMLGIDVQGPTKSIPHSLPNDVLHGASDATLDSWSWTTWALICGVVLLVAGTAGGVRYYMYRRN